MSFLRISIWRPSTGCPSHCAPPQQSIRNGGPTHHAGPRAHTSFAERLAAAERARAGRGAAPDDEGERKGATTLVPLPGGAAESPSCAGRRGADRVRRGPWSVSPRSGRRPPLAHGGGVALVCAFSLRRRRSAAWAPSEGVQSSAAKYLLCALGANFAWRAYRPRGAAPLGEEGGGCPRRPRRQRPSSCSWASWGCWRPASRARASSATGAERAIAVPTRRGEGRVNVLLFASCVLLRGRFSRPERCGSFSTLLTTLWRYG